MVERGSSISRNTPINGNSLTVEYISERYKLAPGQILEFGRDAELSMDSNKYLHRRLGRFEYRNNMWFLLNIGRSLHLNVLDIGTQSQAVIAPGREFAFTFSPAYVRFRAGRTTYELEVTGASLPTVESEQAEHTLDTIIPSEIPLTSSQQLLIVSLAEQTLRTPESGVQVPPSHQAAKRLDWTITKFNRKLDNVCAKLEKAGVPGLHGAPGALASDRRRNLVVFAIQSGLISKDELCMLPHIGRD